MDWLDIGSRVLGPAAMIVGGLLAVYVRSIIAPLATKLDSTCKKTDNARESIIDLYRQIADLRERLARLEGRE